MKLSRKERDERKESFRKMSPSQKADHLYTYYKLPIFLALLAFALLCSFVYRQLTKKEVFLYSAHINVSVGDDLDKQLNEGFIAFTGADPRKSEVYLFRGMYLSDDASDENHQYGYASRIKLLASIESKQLDVVLMNREAYDIFSHNGYLLELPDFLSNDAAQYQFLEPYLTSNTVILEDNAVEYNLREADKYVAVTEEVPNAIDISTFPLFLEAGFPDTVYFGVIANSPRQSAILQYIAYLTSANAEMTD